MTNTNPPATSSAEAQRRDALAERLFGGLLESMELLSVHLGVGLGLYAWLDPDGPADPTELAERTGIRHSIGGMNRPTFNNDLALWLAAVPGLDARSGVRPGAASSMSGAGRAGRPWRWPGCIPTPRCTGSTSLRPPSKRRLAISS